ncbi:ribonuclease E inhibitor RraB [Thalassotalea sp. LPB0316]|uniref:ribonuclease E inhibitor RraB n=1 Tax=Thalassotalea sp. LPB0316 TaxID=2769490 RepID=UPI00186932C2|nr:ribonuclease E inhibitor RraB [Thalassotalea sp. LPB0316]QOL26062.1 ribonuclease E inhibitor RraB [Thalassotalea sp. LPB0316]
MTAIDETTQVLNEMAQAGVDLSVAHDVVFFQLFEKQEQAKQMLVYLQDELPEVRAELLPDEIPNVWDVNVTVNMVPSYQNIVDQEKLFEQIAGQFNGYNDGWGIEA